MLKISEKVQAKVLCEQPKRAGASQNCSVNWDEVLWWREIESEQILMLSVVKQDSQEVLDAKERELSSLKGNNVFNWVGDHGQNSVSCRWVFTEKQKENGCNMLKAPLVAQGFEEKTMNERTDSPICSRQAVRMVFVSFSIML